MCAPKASRFSVFCYLCTGERATCPDSVYLPRNFGAVLFEDLMNWPNIQKMELDPLREASTSRITLLAVSLGLAGLAWYLIAHLGDFPAFILPTPGLVARRFLQALSDGTLLRHSAVTLGEVLVGLGLGATTATGLGYLLAKSRSFERLLAPFIVASQSVPIVAIAPLLVIWFGPGLISKFLICALIVFFPVLVNTIVGLRSVPEELHDLMLSLQASRWQTFRNLEAPAALPVFLGGLRIGATLSVIGAVVGEFVGADRGLGFLINVGRGQYDTALVFVAVFTLIAVAISLYGLVVWLEGRLLAWHQRPERPAITQ
jgi:NitT/TauT family transport system permease protein